MTKRIDLSNGHWADMLDLDEITSGRRKALLRGMHTAEDGSDGVDICLTFLLVRWSYSDCPCPYWDKEQKQCRNIESLDELLAHDIDQLSLHASAVIKGLTPNFEPNPDPKTPTVPSGD